MNPRNRLAGETSPYLRQHADNPVAWYPWGEEAFAAARERDVPVLLSVGYSACHWCHVMAHESFEDPATAELMNRWFVNVKVDREERPDVDAIYMEAVQAMTGHGGWPMTVFLAPDGRPFFGGTYFPPAPRPGQPSFGQLLARVHEAWTTERDAIDDQAGRLTASLNRLADLVPDDGLPGHDVLLDAAAVLRRQHDPAWGGFGGAPKFPQAMSLDALVRAHHHTGDDELLQVVRTSLDAMASGGIYDHLGGGFARYSVDARWLVPHFEKMLYDNALLLRVYLHALQVTALPRYRQVVAETVGYVLRDLRLPDGGIASAEDADSEGEEGRFSVWTLDEVRAVLTAAGLDPEPAIDWYGVTAEGNFEGRNILWRPVRGDLLRPPAIEAARAVLFAHREQRVRPGLDDKVLTEWNALWVASLAEAGAALGEPSWVDAARTTADFLRRELRRPDGRWLRSWQAEGGARHLAYAADHAALVDAFTRLAEATGEARWITEARTTADDLLRLFHDDERGGVFTTGSDAERLVTRPKDLMDDATPSANSLAAVALLRLAALTGETRYRAAAEEVLRLAGGLAAKHPTAFGHLLAAVDLSASGVREVAVVGDRADLVRAVQERYLPDTVLAWGEPYPSPLWDGRTPGSAYVCRNHVCQAPVQTLDALTAQLQRNAPPPSLPVL
jgi:uncharacterized protein YyaL (SSP411 family)